MQLVNNLRNVTVANPVFRVWADRVLSTLAVPVELEQLKPRLRVLAGDAFFLHYSIAPTLRDRNPDPLLNVILSFLQRYAESRTFEEVRAVTVMDHDLSLFYACRFCRYFIRALARKLGLPRPQGGSRRPSGEGRGDGEGGAEGEEGRPAGARRGDGGGCAAPREEDVVRALEEAAREAAEDVREAATIARLIGSRAGKHGTSFETLLRLHDVVKEVYFARQILAVARRMVDESVPPFVRWEKERHPRRGAEVHGYRLTRRVEHALPRELALPDELFWFKLANSGLLAREYATPREGAYYILIDKSLSMAGEKTVWARSVALSLYKLARRKGRKYFLRFFDTLVHPDGEPLSDPEAVVASILTVGIGGGTSIDTALRAALRDLSGPLADLTNTIIIITDGEDKVTVEPEELREVGATLVAVMIKGSNETLRHLAEASGGRYLRATPDERGALKVVEAAAGG